jgi:Toastrack DUF4097
MILTEIIRLLKETGKTRNYLMKNTIIIYVVLLTLSGLLLAQKEMTVDKTFDNIKSLRIKLVLGDCLLEKSTDTRIQIHLTYSDDNEGFEPDFSVNGSRLTVKEKFYGHDQGGNYHWRVQVPAGVKIDLESATGNIGIDGAEVEIDGNTGTGDIEIRNASGDFELNTGTGGISVEKSHGEFELNSGTGRVLVEDCQGNFDVNSGTGKVKGVNLVIDSEVEFNSGTGSAEISAPAGKEFDLQINSGTGDAVLDMQGKSLEGYFEFRAHSRKGKVICSEKFDKVEEYGENGDTYLRKSFTRGKETPRYFLSTGTGEAELKR